jgi:hypothetical protein
MDAVEPEEYFKAVEDNLNFVKTITKKGIRYRRYTCPYCGFNVDIKLNRFIRGYLVDKDRRSDKDRRKSSRRTTR